METDVMQLGVIHLGPTGAYIVRRMLAAGRPCVVYDRCARTVAELAAERAHGAASVPDLVHELDAPRAIWLAGLAADTDATIAELRPCLEADDVVIDCSDSDYAADVRRAAELAERRVHYVDVGICGQMRPGGGTYCLMIGGEEAIVRSLQPLFETLAAPRGYLFCGPVGAGRFVTMIHDGIERRLTAAYAEGFRMLGAANTAWAERDPDYEFNLPEIVDVWRHGAPVASPIMERAAREHAAAHEAGCGLPEMRR
jgi:6-phosphogluconate dehydrogenase